MRSLRISDLIVDQRDRYVFRVHRSAYVSPEILELERERIFDRSWLYVGHESEVADPGDFRTREVAGRPILFCRSSDGEVRVLLNSCTHRGAVVCREAEGNAKTFQCFYHAWTFNNRGDLAGVPDIAGYGPAFRKEELGLIPVPRMTNYRGLVFASFDPDIVDFTEYLAGAKDPLDTILDQGEVDPVRQGMEIVGGTHRYSVRANWKMITENSLESYHVAPLHRSYIEYLRLAGADVSQAPIRGYSAGLGNGHAIEEYEGNWGRPVAKWEPRWGEEARGEIDELRARLRERFGEKHANRVAEWNRNVFIYPNLMINDIMAITLRNYYPVTPDYTEVTAYSLARAGESARWRSLRLDNFLTFLGPGGLSTPDDNEAMESCQRGYRTVKELGWSEMSRGMTRPPEAVDEEQLREFWRRWATQVTGAEVSTARRRLRAAAR